MEYIYGTVRRDGVTVETLKTVGAEHSALAGWTETRREYEDGSILVDRCRVLERFHQEEAGGLCYDWYYIDNHNRYMDTAETKALRTRAETLEEQVSQAQLAMCELYEQLIGTTAGEEA